MGKSTSILFIKSDTAQFERNSHKKTQKRSGRDLTRRKKQVTNVSDARYSLSQPESRKASVSSGGRIAGKKFQKNADMDKKQEKDLLIDRATGRGGLLLSMGKEDNST